MTGHHGGGVPYCQVEVASSLHGLLVQSFGIGGVGTMRLVGISRDVLAIDVALQDTNTSFGRWRARRLRNICCDR